MFCGRADGFIGGSRIKPFILLPDPARIANKLPLVSTQVRTAAYSALMRSAVDAMRALDVGYHAQGPPGQATGVARMGTLTPSNASDVGDTSAVSESENFDLSGHLEVSLSPGTTYETSHRRL